jgi:YegS/Rv2252/BmrU family lipid kinase
MSSGEPTVNRYLVIYNPAAGQGRAGERLPQVERLLRVRGVEHSLLLTRCPGHAIELAREAALENRHRAIVAAGGDGTANEVINGIMAVRAGGAATPALGVLPVGRGNDLAFGAGIPTTLEEAVRVLLDGEVVPMDVGHLKGGLFPDGRYFGNGVGIGFDTIVGFEAAKMKRLKGFAGYLAGALKTLLFYYNAPLLQITTDDGDIAGPCIQVSIMNGRRMGGAFYMAPEADPGDGFLDLCIAGTPRRLQMLMLIFKYLKGAQAGHEHISMGKTVSFRVRSTDGPLAIHADGETISVDGTELEVSCVSGTMDVLRPTIGRSGHG